MDNATVKLSELAAWELSETVAKRVLVGVLELRDSVDEETPLHPHEIIAIFVYTWLWNEAKNRRELLGSVLRSIIRDLEDPIAETWELFSREESQEVRDIRVHLLDEKWVTWSGSRQETVDLDTGEKEPLSKPVISAKMLNITAVISAVIFSVKALRSIAA